MSDSLKYSNIKTLGQVRAEGLEIIGEYTLPTADGTANQILSTDGAGTVQFIDLSNLQIVTATNILNGTGINWTIIGLNTVQGDVTLAPFTTTDLSEGVNLYFTDERVDDRVSNLFQSGITGTSGVTPLTWIYNDALNTFTPQISISAFTTDNLPQGSSNLYFSGELVDDRVAALLKPAITGTHPTNPIIWNYVDGLDSLTPQVSLAPFSTTNLSEGTNLYFTDDRAIDAVGGALVNSATVTWNFNPVLNTIEATASTGISGMAIRLDGGPVGTQPTLEFLTGSNIILSAANDVLNNKVTLQIESTLGGNLEDLNDVFFFSPGPQFEEVLYFNGAGWTSTDLESIMPANYESITYADLKTKALANDLVPNRMYLINDYETIYYMPGTSPQVEMTGSTEPIIVKAIAVNEISPIAYSPSFPQDIIHYKLIPEAGFRNVSATNKGMIYYRYDTIDRNSYPADFRNVECRRWDDGSGNYEALAENGNGFLDKPIFVANCKDNKVESINPDFASDYGINEDLPNVYFLANSVGNSFSAFTYGITPTVSYMSNIQSSGIMVNVVFRNIATSIFNTSTIRNTIFEAQVISLIVKAETNGLGIANSVFSSNVEDCEVSTIDSSTFAGKFSNSRVYSIITSSFGAACQFVDVYSISNVNAASNFTFVQGILLQDCTFGGVVSQFYFKKIQNVDFQGVDECRMADYLNSSPLTVGNNFARNVFLNEISDSSFGDDMIGCTFNGKITNCTFGNNMVDCVFVSTVTNSTFGDDVIRTTFNGRVLSSTFGSAGISYCTFANEVRACTFDNTLSSVYFNGQLDTFVVASTSTALDKVTFITSMPSYTIANGSANLANGNLYTEVVADSLGGSGSLYERYIDLVGSPALPEYTYTVLT